MSERLAVVIMAAGKGRRMKSPERAKVMFPVGGVPMVHHVVQRAIDCRAERIITIIGHNREAVRKYLDGAFVGRVEFAEQVEQRGTGHAVIQAVPALADFDGDVLVLSGDVPLLNSTTINELIGVHRASGAVATVLTVTASDPTGYGRVVRADDGTVECIVEDRDATDEERAIDEINSGIYLFRCADLLQALEQLDTNNAQNEYYLTDVFAWFRRRNALISAYRSEDFGEVQGINTVEQLRRVDDEFSRRVATR